MKISKIASLFLASTVSLFVIGCGGGGGGSSSSSASTSSTVSGSAVDELIGNGVVNVYAGSINGKLLATTRTSDKNDSTYGTYSVTINGYTGPIVVQVSCDGNSTFKEDNGSIVKCNLDVPLYSANIANGGTVVTNITPITTQMVVIATDGNLSKPIDTTALKQAKIKVAAIYGIDPVVNNPVDNTNYKKIINTIHNVAPDGNMSEVIKDLVEDSKDGVIGDDSNVIKDFLTSLSNEINSSYITNGEVNLSDINTSFPYDGIAAVKGVVQSLRDNLYSITNDDQNGTLDEEVKAFNNAINRDVIKNTQDELGVLAYVIDATINTNAPTSGTVTNDNGTYNYQVIANSDNTEFNYTITWNGNDYTGVIKTSQDYKSVNTPDDLNSDMFYEIYGYLPSNDNKKINAYIVAHQNSDNTFTLNLNDVSIKGAQDSLAISNVQIDGKYFTYTDDNNNTNADLNYIRLNNIELNAKLDNRFEINGSLALNWIQNSEIANKYPQGSYQKLYWLEPVLTCINSNNNEATPIGGYVIFKYNGNNYNLNQTWSDNEYNMAFGSNFDNNPLIMADSEGDFWSYVENQNNYDLSNVQCPSGYSPKIEWVNEDIGGDFSNDGFVPNKITFNGVVKDLNTSVELDGKITSTSSDIQNVNLDNNEIPTINTDLNVVLKRPEYPDTTVNADITYNTDETAKLDMTYSFNNDLITINANWNSDKSGEVTITDLTGVKIVVPINTMGDPDYEHTSITFDGETVGKLEPRGDHLFVIHYNDGTSESVY